MSRSDLSPTYLAVEPNGEVRPVEPTYHGIKDGLHDAVFDVVSLDREHDLFIDDEGMLNGSRLNVPASIFTGIALYGPVVLTGGVDREGETQLPSARAVEAFTALAAQWSHVELDAARKGQSLALRPDADALPFTGFVSLNEEEAERYLAGDPETVAEVHRQAREGGD